MINFQIYGLMTTIELLRQEEERHRRFGGSPNDTPLSRVLAGEGLSFLSEGDRRTADGLIAFLTRSSDQLSLSSAHSRLDRLKSTIERGNCTHVDCYIDMKALREALEDELKYLNFYFYEKEKARAVQHFPANWAVVVDKFPTVRDDALAATDCWAMGQPTAAVFHSMRVLEHGLRALASDVGKVFDIQNWQKIIDQIEAGIAPLGKTLPPGVAKNERLQFLAEAAKEFRYFKDGWRNYVSHSRGVYDEDQAKSILGHVKSFMTVLSSRLAE